MSITMRDVAKASKVSVYTVSSVLHNKGDVGDATRERVLKVIRDLKYDPLKNIPLARILRAPNKTMGMVVPAANSAAGTFFYRGITAAREAAADLGYDCKLYSEQDLEHIVIDKFHQGRKQLECGSMLLFCPNRKWRELAENLSVWEIPVALVRRSLKKKGILTVNDSDYDGARLALDHLVKAGHRNVAVISDHPGGGESPERIRAYKDLVAGGALADDPRLRIVLSECDDLGSRIKELRESGLDITAVFCFSDDIAARTIGSLGRAGLRVPDDIAVTGYDDDALAEQVYPSLTTVRIPVEPMVRAACKALADYEPGSGMKAMDLTFENELIIRESCGAGKNVIN